MGQDSAGNEYQEVAITGGSIRLTYVKKGWNSEPSVRVQVWDAQARQLRQGPEIPVSKLGDTFGMVIRLLSDSKGRD